MQKKWNISDEFGLRNLVIQKLLQTKTAASLVAHGAYFNMAKATIIRGLCCCFRCIFCNGWG